MSLYENLLKATDNTGDITTEKFGVITSKNGNYCNVKETESGLEHTNVPIVNGASLEVGDKVIIGFIDNSIYDVVCYGCLDRTVGGGGSSVDIVTEWESPTSDSKVPSEKLVKDSLDGKAASSHTHQKSQITDFPILSTVATSGSYNDLTNQPSIPSNTSDLNNDAGFITSASLPTKTSELANDGSSSSDSLVYVETSTTSGLIKNDGTVDTTTYLSSLPSHNHDDRYYTESEMDTALGNKQNTLVSGTNIKTINNESLLGSGNITIEGGGSEEDTGWKNCSYETGYSIYDATTTPLQVRRVGKIVHIRGYWSVSSTQSASTASVKFASLPAGFSPEDNIRVLQQGSGKNNYLLNISPNGEIGWSRYGTTSSDSLPSGVWGNAFTSWLSKDYIYYDDCNSSTNLSKYSSPISVYNSSLSGTAALAYDSTTNAYSIAGGNSQDWNVFRIPALDGATNITISLEMRVNANGTYPYFGFAVFPSESSLDTTYADLFYSFRNSTTGIYMYCQRRKKTSYENINTASDTFDLSNWFRLVLAFDDTNGVTATWETLAGVQINKVTTTVSAASNDRHYGLFCRGSSGNYGRIRNIQVWRN